MKTVLKGFVCAGDFSDISRRAVLIENGRIAAVQKDIIGTAAADKIYSFKDEIIAPGFIDAHGHSDLSAPAAPECFSKISQGITSEVCGNCGLSPFPVTGNNREHLEELYSNYALPVNWDDHHTYCRKISEYAPAVKLFALCGHNTLRAAVAGYEKKELSGAELAAMCNLLEDQLRSGAPGLSTGLLYVPGCFAPPDELLALMRTLAANNKVYTTHLRSEGTTLLESLSETLSLARQAGLKKVLISHLKTAGQDNFHKIDAALDMISEYRESGMDIRFDRYPYVESQTMLSVTLGDAYSKYGDSELQKLFTDPEERFRAISHLHCTRDEKYWQSRRLAGTKADKYRKYQGWFFADIPSDPAETVVDILRCNAADSMVAAANMSEENMQRIISHELCLFGSDGHCLPPDERFGRPHPRSCGAAAKFARRLLDSGMDIARVCRKLSGAAAEFFNIPGYGAIVPGHHADITIFSPEEIDSRADFSDPFRIADGIRAVFTDGTVSFPG